MNRKLVRAICALLLTGLLMQVPALADENGIVDVPDAAVMGMDLGRAMDIVTFHMGRYWLRSLRWTCPYKTRAGTAAVDHYGVRLEKFLGVHVGKTPSWPLFGTVLFEYAPVPHNYCRIPAQLASPQVAVELATAFARLAKEPAPSRQAAIAARYTLDQANVASIQRFLVTEASLDTARLLLEDAVRSLVQPGGAGESVGDPPPLPAGSEYRESADYVLETVEPSANYEWSFRVLAAGPNDFEVQKVRGDRVQDCKDRNYFRAITHTAPQSCRDHGGATTKTTLIADEGQVSYLPATINTVSVHEAESEQVVTLLSSGRQFTMRSRTIRACYAEATEKIAVPAGSFDTVRLRCGSVESGGTSYDKRYGLVWVDRRTGLPVRSEMEVHSVYGSTRYRLNVKVISFGKP